LQRWWILKNLLHLIFFLVAWKSITCRERKKIILGISSDIGQQAYWTLNEPRIFFHKSIQSSPPLLDHCQNIPQKFLIHSPTFNTRDGNFKGFGCGSTNIKTTSDGFFKFLASYKSFVGTIVNNFSSRCDFYCNKQLVLCNLIQVIFSTTFCLLCGIRWMNDLSKWKWTFLTVLKELEKYKSFKFLFYALRSESLKAHFLLWLGTFVGIFVPSWVKDYPEVPAGVWTHDPQIPSKCHDH